LKGFLKRKLIRTDGFGEVAQAFEDISKADERKSLRFAFNNPYSRGLLRDFKVGLCEPSRVLLEPF